jgi:hypothetical protein
MRRWAGWLVAILVITSCPAVATGGAHHAPRKGALADGQIVRSIEALSNSDWRVEDVINQHPGRDDFPFVVVVLRRASCTNPDFELDPMDHGQCGGARRLVVLQPVHTGFRISAISEHYLLCARCYGDEHTLDGPRISVSALGIEITQGEYGNHASYEKLSQLFAYDARAHKFLLMQSEYNVRDGVRGISLFVETSNDSGARGIEGQMPKEDLTAKPDPYFRLEEHIAPTELDLEHAALYVGGKWGAATDASYRDAKYRY